MIYNAFDSTTFLLLHEPEEEEFNMQRTQK